ncbi:hypothetical protein [Pinibacter soli]|uniref:Transmembrane protein n=1 Tax=Pinibacter soli TaxID=3044211 RepID=A0ABT6R6Z1_9BACT|nr:hypothetical protein [Pinibacter soli]MDI3318223.1 hypothetical protein [Pinibacter soli]
MSTPKFLCDFMHFLPTLLLSIIIVIVLRFVFRKKEKGKIKAWCIGLIAGVLLYLNGDAFLNAKRYYKGHQKELEQVVSLYKRTSSKVNYNLWLGPNNKFNIEPIGNTECPYQFFKYGSKEQEDIVCQNAFIKAGVNKNEMDSLVALMLETGYIELYNSRGAKSSDDPQVVGVTYKHTPFLFCYYYGLGFVQNGYQIERSEQQWVGENVYFYKGRYSPINGY